MADHPIDIAELRRLHEAATQGPWRAVPLGGSSTVLTEMRPRRNDTRIPAYAYGDEHCLAYPFIEEDLRARWDFVCFSHDDARLIAAMRHALPALLDRIEAETWQPIETAPKDGTPILVWADGYEWPEVIRWYAYDPEDAAEIGELGYWHYAEETLAESYDWLHEVTHWRPLPAAPTTGGAND